MGPLLSLAWSAGDLGWTDWARPVMAPGRCTVDLHLTTFRLYAVDVTELQSCGRLDVRGIIHAHKF